MSFFFFKIVKFSGSSNTTIPIFIFKLEYISVFQIFYILFGSLDLVPDLKIAKKCLIFIEIDVPCMDWANCWVMVYWTAFS